MVIMMLKKRVISAVIGILLLFLLVFSGSFVFFLTAAVIAALGIREFAGILEIKSNFLKLILYISSIMLVFNSYLITNDYNYLPYGIILFIIILSLYLYQLFNYSENDFMKNISYQFFGIIYIAGGLSFAVFLHDFSAPPFFNTTALWFVLTATWITDTGAYFTGKKFGKKSMAPIISPNKTVAGAVGGIFTTALFIIFITLSFNIFNIYWFVFAVSFPIVAIVGDLFESCLKRNFNIKDTGTIIPGHGGILDRFDSFIFVIPFAAFYLVIISLIN